jgi:hypothetical protein
VFSLKIDGVWEPGDFIETFEAIETLYYLGLGHPSYDPFWLGYRLVDDGREAYSAFEAYRDTAARMMLARARSVVPQEQRLYVDRVQFASPGGIDFAGLGRVAEALDRLTGRLIDFFADKRLRHERDEQAALDTEMKRQNLASLKIDNARKLLELRRDFPDDEHLIALAVREQDKLADRIAQGMITGTGDKDENKE